MGLDFIYEGGRSVGVGSEGVEDGVDLAPEVAIGALFERGTFERSVRVKPLDDITGVDPQDPHEVSGAELEKSEETEGLSAGH